MRFNFLIGILLPALMGFEAYSQKTGELTGVKKKPDILKSLPKELKIFYQDMVYIPAGSFTSGDDPTDTSSKEMLISVSAFYMSSKEVTNKQYREFYESKVKELGKEKAKEFLPKQAQGALYMPDLERTFSDSLYFMHPVYNDYPITGVSWEQANAYCTWLSNKVMDVVKSHEGWFDKYAMPQFRLPTEMEWEYAAYGGLSRALYSFGTSLFDKKKPGAYNANFGLIKDEKGLGVKQLYEDGYYTTAPVKSFAPNGFGLYNMSGNVNEWVMDVYRERTYYFSNDLSPAWQRSRFVEYDSVKTENLDKRVIKGGGFLDIPYYLMVSSRRKLDVMQGRCDVGFRVCMTYALLPREDL